MVGENLALMNELYGLSVGLLQANTLTLTQTATCLECRFLDGGLVTHTVEVHDKVLASALWQECVLGILEGVYFANFRISFGVFSLHVKTRKLYLDLKADNVQSAIDGRAVA